MNARIITQDGQPWLIVTSVDGLQRPITILDMPLDLSSKRTTKLEIDWAHDKTGIPRPDLYDTIRAYTKGQPVVAGRPQRAPRTQGGRGTA